MTKSIVFILSLFIFLCGFVLHAQDARLSLTRNSLTLNELFRKIEARTDFNIGHSNLINKNTTITLAERSGTVLQIISDALKETKYTYRTIGKYILIVPDVVEEVAVAPAPPVPVAHPPVIEEIIKEEPEPVEIESPRVVCSSCLYDPCMCICTYVPPVMPTASVEIPEQEEEVITPPVIRQNFPPRFALKTNVLYLATGTINLGVEFPLNNHFSLDISSGWNPFVFRDNTRFTHVMIQPTLRYWIREPFRGDFFGVSLMYSHFNMGGISLPFTMLPGFANYRFRGNVYGVSLQYGHQWRLSPNWGIETTVNVGHLFLNYDTFERGRHGKKIESNRRHFFGPTNASVSLIYFIR